MPISLRVLAVHLVCSGQQAGSWLSCHYSHWAGSFSGAQLQSAGDLRTSPQEVTKELKGLQQRYRALQVGAAACGHQHAVLYIGLGCTACHLTYMGALLSLLATACIAARRNA